MWKQYVLASAIFAVLLPYQPAWGDSSGAKGGADRPHRVVMHVNSGDEHIQRAALNNIRHLYQEVGRERLQLELVVHGGALSLLTRTATTLGSELAQLKAEYGVAYTACSNTMKAMNITREDLIGEVGDTVSAIIR